MANAATKYVVNVLVLVSKSYALPSMQSTET